MNAIPKSYILNCCEKWGKHLDFSKDKYFSYSEFSNFNYSSPKRVS